MVKARDDEPNISIDPRVAFMVSDILNEALIQNVKRRGLKMPITNMGGKTGTTNDATSTWFSGYASHVVASAWVGKDDGSSLGDNEFGSTNALPIWIDFMSYSKNKLSDYSVYPFLIPKIYLDFDIGKDYVVVKSSMIIKPKLKESSKLILQGNQIKLISISINGKE